MNISAVRDSSHIPIRFELHGDSDYPLKDRVKYLFITSVTLLVAQIALAFFLNLPMIAFIYMAITIGFIFYANRVITEAGKYPTPVEYQALQDEVDELTQSLQEANEEHTTENGKLQQELKVAKKQKIDQLDLQKQTHDKAIQLLQTTMKQERDTSEKQITSNFEKKISDLKDQYENEKALLKDNLEQQKQLYSKLTEVKGEGGNQVNSVLTGRIQELTTSLEKKETEYKQQVEKLNSDKTLELNQLSKKLEGEKADALKRLEEELSRKSTEALKKQEEELSRKSTEALKKQETELGRKSTEALERQRTQLTSTNSQKGTIEKNILQIKEQEQLVKLEFEKFKQRIDQEKQKLEKDATHQKEKVTKHLNDYTAECVDKEKVLEVKFNEKKKALQEEIDQLKKAKEQLEQT